MLPAAAGDAEKACAAGECEKAIGILEKAMAESPQDFRLYYRLGLCYGGSCRPHPLADDGMAVAYLQRASILTAGTTGIDRATVLDQLANTLSQGPPDAEALRSAIECHREAAEIYVSLGMVDDWARTQFNLGNSCCDLAELAGEDHWQQAVVHYEQCLRVRMPENEAERYAAVLENLGTAYRQLAAGGTPENIRKSIVCYQRALRVSRDAPPARRAALENNLANALLSLPAGDPGLAARNALRALRHLDRALRIQAGEGAQRQYAISQYNRAQAYCRLAQTVPGFDLQRAVDCFREALTIFQSCGDARHAQLVRTRLEKISP